MFLFKAATGNPQLFLQYQLQPNSLKVGHWNLFEAKKKSNGQSVSCFVFDKQQVESKQSHISSTEKDLLYKRLRKEAEQMTRLRHPNVLLIVEPLEEARNALCFVTEPLQTTLQTLIQPSNYKKHDMKMNLIQEDHSTMINTLLDELEVQKGISQIAKALEFCHSIQMIHGNIHPDSILINQKGDWKLGGFGYCRMFSPGHDQVRLDDFDLQTYQSETYLSPEMKKNFSLSTKSDIYSLGCIILAIYNQGTLPSSSFSQDYRNSIDVIPAEFRDFVKMMLSLNPLERPTASNFQKSSFFDNLPMQTMNFLESLFEKTQQQKSQFFKGLTSVLPRFSEKILLIKILPILVQELQDPNIIPLILPNIFYIVNKQDSNQFIQNVMPSLLKIYKIKEPVQCVLSLLDFTDIIISKSTQDVLKFEISPALISLLEAQHPYILQKVLKHLPALFSVIDYNTSKTQIFPRLQALVLQSTNVSVLVNILVCFKSILKAIEKSTLIDQLFPILKQVKAKHISIVMAMVYLYEELVNYVDKEVLVEEIIPNLFKLSISNYLDKDKFKEILKIIRGIEDRLEKIQLRYLEESSRISEENKTSEITDFSQFEALVKSPTTSPIMNQNLQISNNQLPISQSQPPLPPARPSASTFADFTNFSLNTPMSFGSIGQTIKKNNEQSNSYSTANFKDFDPFFK